MGSINPQVLYPDYPTLFPTDFSELNIDHIPSSSMVGGSGNYWGGEEINTFIPIPNSFDDLGNFDHQTVSSSSELYSDAAINSSYQTCDQYEVGRLDTATATATGVVALPELNMCGIAASATGFDQNFYAGFQPPPPPPSADYRFFEFRDDCFGLVPDLKPLYHPLPAENWETQRCNQVPAIEDSNIKVSRYSEEVRKERILRYLKKRNQRNFNKTIKYACRKTLADRRIRVRGRFARNNELLACDDQQQIILPQNNINDDTNSIHKQELYDHHNNLGVQMKKDEEEWLQEITSLMYYPYITS